MKTILTIMSKATAIIVAFFVMLAAVMSVLATFGYLITNHSWAVCFHSDVVIFVGFVATGFVTLVAAVTYLENKQQERFGYQGK